MNELIALGVGLTDVIRMVTVNAATMLGLTDELGSLAPGRVADVSVLAIDEDDWTLQDSLGVRIKTDKRLRPVLALRAGKVHRSQSPLLEEAGSRGRVTRRSQFVRLESRLQADRDTSKPKQNFATPQPVWALVAT